MCGKWFYEKPWIYIYDRRYFCQPSCVVDYCLDNTPEMPIAELDFRIKAMPIPRKPRKNLNGHLSWKSEEK